jgi:hypothetical protein
VKTNYEDHPVYRMPVGRVYQALLTKVERKGRTKDELDQLVRWLTGYTQKGLDAQIAKGTEFETFFAKAPKMNPNRALITGMICGVRVEEIEHPTMKAVRQLDKLVDELAKGRAMEKILRKS